MEEVVKTEVKTEVVRKRKSKVEKYYYNGIEFTEKIIDIDRAEGRYISEISCCGKRYKSEIVYSEDRAKFQAWITHEDRRISLSFFTLQKIAKDNILKTLCYWNGQTQGQVKSESQVGD